MWAFVLHRITGLGLIFYLLLHILVISSVLLGGGTFDQVLGFLQQPFFIVLEMGLVFCVVYHALNGTRLLLFDLGLGVRRQKLLFWLAMVAAAALLALILAEMIPLLFKH